MVLFLCKFFWVENFELLILQVIHSFDAQSEGELSLSVGEYVVVRQVLCFPPSGKGYSIVHYILLLYFFLSATVKKY